MLGLKKRRRRGRRSFQITTTLDKDIQSLENHDYFIRLKQSTNNTQNYKSSLKSVLDQEGLRPARLNLNRLNRTCPVQSEANTDVNEFY